MRTTEERETDSGEAGRTEPGSVSVPLERAAAKGLLDDESPAAMFVDLGALDARMEALRRALPEAFHTLAIKVLPLPPLLRRALGGGFGLEVASMGEMALAAFAGASPDEIFFDGPAKTRAEIGFALRHRIRVNVDNLQELERVARQIDGPTRGIGLRVNPCLEGASIASTFTASATAKFGVPLDRHRPDVMNAFERHPWLDGLHVHVGSQGCPVDLLVEGVGRVASLAEELEARGRPVDVVNIGGGLPVAYRPFERTTSFAQYAKALRARAPSLFDGRVRLVTEFGRALLAPAAWVASRVEYVRTGTTDETAVVHVGADMFLRTAYRPEDWYHEVEVYDRDGRPKDGARAPRSIAGPLCFSSDYIATARELPRIEPGDILVIRDSGAYTLGMWSRYNSRAMPAVYGYVDGEEGFELLKPRESLEDVVRFWSPGRNGSSVEAPFDAWGSS